MVSQRASRLPALLAERILLLDGGMGTMLQEYRLSEVDYRGTRFADWPRDLKGNNDLLVLTQPEIVGAIHGKYLAAGADILETNTFNANAISMADYGMEALAYELNVAGAALARRVADERRRLIAELRNSGIADESVLAAIASVDRERFVTQTFAERAWENTALPIAFGQTISQPLVVAAMTEALRVGPRMKVLAQAQKQGLLAKSKSSRAEIVKIQGEIKKLIQGIYIPVKKSSQSDKLVPAYICAVCYAMGANYGYANNMTQQAARLRHVALLQRRAHAAGMNRVKAALLVGGDLLALHLLVETLFNGRDHCLCCGGAT
jgi:hypothetical protein